MKLLLTGASSFTGAWFATSLAAAGHEVTATLQGAAEQYTELRGERVERLRSAGVRLIPKCSFGDETFLAALEQGFDVLCHHGANVTNYKSADFDVVGALQANTNNIRRVLEAGKANGLRSLVATGSVFEQDEGAGSSPMRAFSPYGLSKGLTWQVLKYWATVTETPLHKFVIPNPFGPQEEPRFCAYLIQRWVKGETATVGTPDYVRDNIHVSLLAAAYADFVRSSVETTDGQHCGPSGYIETQGAFATRFAAEIGKRLSIETPLLLGKQTDFSEPFSRVNTDNVRTRLSWDESGAWDQLADYYRSRYVGNL